MFSRTLGWWVVVFGIGGAAAWAFSPGLRTQMAALCDSQAGWTVPPPAASLAALREAAAIAAYRARPDHVRILIGDDAKQWSAWAKPLRTCSSLNVSTRRAIVSKRVKLTICSSSRTNSG